MAEWTYNPGLDGNLPISHGMGVRHHDVSAADRGANATLENQDGDQLSLWVYEVEASFEMAGAKAQSLRQRDFYAHNFVQPTFKVRGQTANNYEYNRLSEFIRYSHRRAVFFGEHDLDAPTIRLTLLAGGQSTVRNHKGAHQRLVLEGVIPTFGRGAKRFEFMHPVEFDFVVTRSVEGLMKDSQELGSRLISWAEVVLAKGTAPFVQNPQAPYMVPDRPPLTPGANGQDRPN